MLEQFGPQMWMTDGPDVVAALGFHYPTRMAVIRLSGGDLFVWSPTALTEALRAEINGLGRVRHLVAPNSLHHVFLADWKRAYPDALVYAPPGLRQKRRDIDFDLDLDDAPIADWAGQVDHIVMAGNVIVTEVVFFHRQSGTVLFTDLLQNMQSSRFSGWRAIVAKLDLMVAAEPSVPRKFRAGFTNRRTARAALGSILAWPVEKVLMAHGTPVTAGGRALLERAFRWLR